MSANELDLTKFDPIKININLDLSKPKGVEISKAELDTVLQGAVSFIQFHLNLIVAQKTKNPNPNLN